MVEGDWLVARLQSSGRGRKNRQWQSLDGNFHGSTLILLRPGDPHAPSLSLACGLALHDAVTIVAPGAAIELKWPNDLMQGGAKLAGILLERSGERVVAGFGVNLALAPSLADRPTAALAAERRIAPEAFAPILAAALARRLRQWRTDGLATMVADWLERGHKLGSRLTVIGADDRPLAGRFAGLDDDGALRLHLADGSLRVMHAGDVVTAEER